MVRLFGECESDGLKSVAGSLELVKVKPDVIAPLIPEVLAREVSGPRFEPESPYLVFAVAFDAADRANS